MKKKPSTEQFIVLEDEKCVQHFVLYLDSYFFYPNENLISMPSNNHSISFPEFIIQLGPNWDNFVIQNPSILGKTNISLELKMFCVLNGTHSCYKNNWWYYMNLGSIWRKLFQVAQRNCPKYLLESFKCQFIWSHQIVCELSSVIKFIDTWRMIWT